MRTTSLVLNAGTKNVRIDTEKPADFGTRKDVTGKIVVPIFTNTPMGQEKVTAMRKEEHVTNTEEDHAA